MTGGVAYQWTNTGIGLNTASETVRCQFEDRECSTEAIYSGSDQNYDSMNEKTRQVGKGDNFADNIIS